MEPTNFLAISSYYFFIRFLFDTQYQYNFFVLSLFLGEIPRKKKRTNRGWEGYSSKSRWNYYFIHLQNPFC
jgi:hypothetical protein